MVEGSRLPTRAVLVESAHDNLMRSPEVPGKARKRARILAEHPGYYLPINTQRLRGIIPYMDFRCHPKSSVARGAAIRGSDIDGGLVILPGRMDQEAQLVVELAFVQELRDQGFYVYHPTEYSEINERFISASEDDKAGLIGELIKRQYNTIDFYTELELEEMITGKTLSEPAMIYLAGTSIPSWPNG